MWSRRQWGRVVAWTCMGAGLPALRAQIPSAVVTAPPLIRAPLGRVVVAVGHKASFCYLPLTIAERLGYFAAEGLDVQVREIGEAGQALQAVLSGAAQVLSGPYSETIGLQMRGQSYSAFVLQGRTPQLVLGVSRQQMPRFRDLRDLRGRRVGVTTLGSAGHRVARMLLAREGVGPQDVQYQALPTPAVALAAFRAGELDALCYHDPLITQLELASELRVVADTRTLRGNADVFGGPLPAGSLCASSAFLNENPKACQAMADAMVHALKWLQTAGPSDLNKTVPEHYFQGDRGLYFAAFSRARESWVPDGMMPETGPLAAVRMLSQFGDAQQLQRVDLATTFTNLFAGKAKARFRA